MVISTQFVVGGSPKNQATSLRDLVAQAKNNAGKLNYGSSGLGSSLHLFAEMFKDAARVDIVHVPYRGDAPMMTALIAGDIQLHSCRRRPASPISAAISSAASRSPGPSAWSPPDVPTVGEQGIGGFEVGSWIGLFALAATPPATVGALQQLMAKVLADPQVRQRLMSTGQEPVGNPPAEFSAQFKTDIARFAKVIEQAKLPSWIKVRATDG